MHLTIPSLGQLEQRRYCACSLKLGISNVTLAQKLLEKKVFALLSFLTTVTQCLTQRTLRGTFVCPTVSKFSFHHNKENYYHKSGNIL